MKKIALLILSILMLTTFMACGKTPKLEPQAQIEESRMRSICDLATMECYYHNVAKFDEKNAETGFLGLFKKDKRFWIEYSGVVKFGIKAADLKIVVEGENVTVTIPSAKVLSSKVDETTLNKDSFIVAEKSAQVVAEDEMMAIKQAQEYMVKAASENADLLASTQYRVKTLLEEYIKNIGAQIGVDYHVNWIFSDNEVGAP